MKKAIISILTLFLFFAGYSQEFIPSNLNLDIQDVSSCAACDGSCTVDMQSNDPFTFRWNDETGTILLIEDNVTGISSISNLCLGSYQLVVSSGSEIVGETYFSITEPGVELGSPGAIYSCSNYETIILDDFEPAVMAGQGEWENENGIVVNTLDIDSQTSGIYRYVVNNSGCLNHIAIPIIINEPANAGNETNFLPCEDFDVIDMFEAMAGDPDPNGNWLDSDFEEVDQYFDPGVDASEVFRYYIDTVPGCAPSFAPFGVNVQYIPVAGEDAVAHICSIDNNTLDLADFLDANADGGGTWFNNQNTQINSVLTSTQIQEGLYRYTLNAAAQCPPDLAYVEIVFIDDLTSGTGGVVEFCSLGNEVSLTSLLNDTPTAGGQWSDSNGDPVNDLFNPETDLGGEYEYEVSGLGCTTEVTTLEIIREQFHSAGSDTLVVLCESDQLVDMNDYLSNEASDIGVWDLEGESIMGTPIELLPGAYDFEYTIDHEICLPEEASINIQIDDNPVFPAIPDLAFCESEGIGSLEEEVALNSLWTQTWSDSNGNIVDESIDLTVFENQTLSLHIDPENTCPEANIDVNIIVEQNQFSNQSVELDYCYTGEIVNLDSLIPAEILEFDYHWEDSEGQEISNEANLEENVYSLSATESDYLSCQSNSVELTINSFDFNEPTFTLTEDYCESEVEVDLNSFVDIEGEWSFGLVALQNTIIEQSPENSGFYTFAPANHESCISTAYINQLNFHEQFDYIPISDFTICYEEEAFLESPLVENEYNTSWSFEGLIYTGESVTLGNLELGENSVEYTISDGICEQTDFVNIVQQSEFLVEILGESQVCEGEELALQSTQGVTGNWYLGEDLILSDTDEYIFSPLTIETVTLLVTNEIGCTSETEHFYNLLESPEVEINHSELQGCIPFEINLENVLDQVNTFYQWNIGDEIFTTSEVSLLINEPGSSDITLSAVNVNGCQSLSVNTLTALGWESPEAHFVLSETEISDIDPVVEIENTSEGEFFSLWTIDGVEKDVNSDLWQHEFEDEPYQSHEVCLEIESVFGCTDYHCESVFVSSELIVYMPNSFTPDNDGINDLFFAEISGHSIDQYELAVFDRWGEQIFHTNDPLEKWNGNVKNGGYYAHPGVYTYQLKVRSLYTAELKTITGHVTLLR